MRFRPVLQAPEQAAPASSGSAPATSGSASGTGSGPARGGPARPDDYVAACSQDGRTKYLLGPTIIEGTDVTNASAGTQSTTGEWVVLLDFNGKARATWAEYTANNVGKNVAFIVAIGITADSFVVFFERIKDEVREGRTLRSAVPRAWVRARRTILSADAVSFLAAAILYVLAIGDVKGFAFTLGMSTVLDLVVVFLFTHPLMAVLARDPAFGSTGWSGLGRVDKAGRKPRATLAAERELVG